MRRIAELVCAIKSLLELGSLTEVYPITDHDATGNQGTLDHYKFASLVSLGGLRLPGWNLGNVSLPLLQ